MGKFCVVLCWLIITAQLIYSQTYLYVSQRGDNSVSIYSVNASTGDLTFVNKQTVSTPTSMTIHPNRKFLYVAQAAAKKVSSFAIDSVSGKLTLLNEIAVVDVATYLSVDKSGQYLSSVYFNVDKALVYSIQNNGRLVQAPVQEITTGDQPHAILTDPSNKFVYVSNMTGNRMEQYRFDQQTGLANPLNPFATIPTENDCPRHFVFNSNGTMLYVANEVGNNLTVYAMNNLSGQLVEVQKVKTIPLTFSGISKCADIHITPDNKYVYVSNRGHESIAAFKINETDGKVSVIDYYPTVKNPREFDIDPTGKFMYVASVDDAKMMSFSIKPDGTLSVLKTIVIAQNPMWVTTVQYNKSTTSVTKTQLDGHEAQRFVAYPNPFSDHLTIKWLSGNSMPKEVRFYDVSGRLMSNMAGYNIDNKADEIHFHFSSTFPKGLFYCQIVDGEKTEVLNLIRQ